MFGWFTMRVVQRVVTGRLRPDGYRSRRSDKCGDITFRRRFVFGEGNSLGGNVMRKVLSSVLIGVTSLALLSTTVIAASAATTTAATKCNGIDAPKSMNDMPASADCPTAGAVLHSNLAPAATPVQATSPISSTPLAFDRTNGDLLAITKISGTNDIAFGGNFTAVFTPDGVSHPAVNFAVVDETSGAIIYAGNPSNSVTPSDNYVRAITSLNGVIYVGGDFDGWDGVARTRVAMLSPTGTSPAWSVNSSWHPSPAGVIRGLAVLWKCTRCTQVLGAEEGAR